jgi:hypothetical protein
MLMTGKLGKYEPSSLSLSLSQPKKKWNKGKSRRY